MSIFRHYLDSSVGAKSMNSFALNGQQIGQLVMFEHRHGCTGVLSLVVGELREVHHDAGGVIVNIAAHDNDHAGEKSQYVLSSDAVVRVGIPGE